MYSRFSALTGLILASCLIVSCETEESEQTVLQVETKKVSHQSSEEGILCKVDVTYPQITGHDDPITEALINSMLIDGFLTEAITDLDVCPETFSDLIVENSVLDHSTTVSYTIELLTEKILSIRGFTSQFLEGAAHPVNEQEGWTINLETGHRYLIDEIFTEGTDVQDLISIIVDEKLKELEMKLPSDFEVSNVIFVLREGKLILTNLTSVYAIQGLEVEVPLGEIGDLLTPELRISPST